MKKYIFTFLLVIYSGLYSYSQLETQPNNWQELQNIPQEKVFLHFNTSLLLSGENLYYKVYCINTANNQLSSISKIAYVELVGADKQNAFKHKIKLKNGTGFGDFFIPASIPTGKYKLLAYTNWMLNNDKNYFFQADIDIINPFQKSQNILTNKKGEINNDSLTTSRLKLKDASFFSKTENDYIKLTSNSNSFSKREKVDLKIESLTKQVGYGNYSISVRKIDTINTPLRPNSITYGTMYPKQTKIEKVNHLPELRGEILTGRVLFKVTENPVANIKVGLSIPGKQPIFLVANTNSDGYFYFIIDKDYENEKGIFQIIDDSKSNYEISLNLDFPVNVDDLKFDNLYVDPNLKEIILQKSIYNQIENAYSSAKPNSTDSLNEIEPFYNSLQKEYVLDDYTRFPTIEETVIEIIDEIYIRERKGVSTFHVRVYDEVVESEVVALVLVDGILLQNQNELVDFNARKVEKISVVTDKYIYNSRIFEGIISIETKNGDFNLNSNENEFVLTNLFKPSKEIKYYEEQYESDSKNRIADFRSQLLWLPNFTLNKINQTISFYTSDNVGSYEVIVEGFTENGIPVSIREIISVH